MLVYVLIGLSLSLAGVAGLQLTYSFISIGSIGTQKASQPVGQDLPKPDRTARTAESYNAKPRRDKRKILEQHI